SLTEPMTPFGTGGEVPIRSRISRWILEAISGIGIARLLIESSTPNGTFQMAERPRRARSGICHVPFGMLDSIATSLGRAALHLLASHRLCPPRAIPAELHRRGMIDTEPRAVGRAVEAGAREVAEEDRSGGRPGLHEDEWGPPPAPGRGAQLELPGVER